MLECLVNGEILALVPASDRGLNYGDGIFETLAVRQGRPRFWQDHMDRLAVGCERLGMAVPAQAVLLREVQTVSAGQAQCVVKIVLTRGGGGRGYRPAKITEPGRVVSAHSWPVGIEQAANTGIVTRICELKLSLQPRTGGIKHLNRLEQVLASAELEGHDATEGILLDADGYLISAISANLFLVNGKQLLTPRLDRSGVRGVLRARILQAFKTRCELRRISCDMLAETDEVFLCNSVRGIIPVRCIDERRFPVGAVTRELQAWLEGVLNKE